MKNRRRSPRITPMTIPAIAPPLRPLLVTVADMPATAAVLTGVWKGTVVVAEPTEVTVTTVALVGRINAVTVGVVA